MIDINIYESQTCKTVSFGRKGENLARRVLFDMSALVAEFGAGSFEWVIRRPHESTVYIAVNKEQDGNTAILNLTTTETAISGYGGLELRYYVDDVIVKTIVWRTSIAASLGGGDVPDPIEDYIDQMHEIAQDASESADAAGESATQAAVSAVNAAGSATEAAGYAAQAAASASASAGSATDSAASASAAHNSETNAANSATQASGFATQAANSASAASGSASQAASSVTQAAGSASAAANSATQAAQSATAAAQSATAADQSAQDIAASSAQIETNRTDITELKNDLTTLTNKISYVPEQINFADLTYLERYYITNSGKSCSASVTYVTFSYHAAENTHIKIKTTKDSSNRYTLLRASICNADLTQTTATEGVLQQISSDETECECNLSAGEYLAFTIYCYSMDTASEVYNHFEITKNGENFYMPNLLIEKSQITDLIEGPKIGVEILTNQYDITLNGYKVKLIHEVDTSNRKDCWTIRGIFYNTDVICPAGTDIIGVLQEIGESDFMGGLHGDESVVNFNIFGDGSLLTEDGTYNQVDVFMCSHLTRPSTGSNVIDRVVHIIFKNNHIDVETTFICLVDNFALSYAYNGGMFAWYDTDASYQISNVGIINTESGDVSLTLQRSDKLYSASANVKGHLVCVENIIGKGNSNYLGETYYYGSTDKRVKMYYSTEHNTTWNSGHVCAGKSRYTLV